MSYGNRQISRSLTVYLLKLTCVAAAQLMLGGATSHALTRVNRLATTCRSAARFFCLLPVHNKMCGGATHRVQSRVESRVKDAAPSRQIRNRTRAACSVAPFSGRPESKSQQQKLRVTVGPLFYVSCCNISFSHRRHAAPLAAAPIPASFGSTSLIS